MFWCVTIFTAGNIAQQHFPFSQIVCEQTNRVMTYLSAEYFKMAIRGKTTSEYLFKIFKIADYKCCILGHKPL